MTAPWPCGHAEATRGRPKPAAPAHPLPGPRRSESQAAQYICVVEAAREGRDELAAPKSCRKKSRQRPQSPHIRPCTRTRVHTQTRIHVCTPETARTHAHASRLCRGPQGNTSEGKPPLPWLLRPLLALWMRGPRGQPQPCGTPDTDGGEAALAMLEGRGPGRQGLKEPQISSHPSHTGERPQLRHLQIKDQVVEPFLGDAVVQPHCGDRRGHEGLAQPGTRPRCAAPLPCGGAHPSRQGPGAPQSRGLQDRARRESHGSREGIHGALGVRCPLSSARGRPSPLSAPRPGHRASQAGWGQRVKARWTRPWKGAAHRRGAP